MKGFSLVELIIAMAITLLVTAATVSFLGPAHDAFQVQPESADVQQRIRVGIDAMLRDLLMAGAGMYSAGATGPLNGAIAPVLPYRAFVNGVGGAGFSTDAISLLYVPSTPSQATLAAPLAPGSLDMVLETSANCPASTPTQFCGLEADDQVLIFDRNGQWDVFDVDRVAAFTGQLHVKGEVPQRGFAAGSNVAEVKAVTYALKADPQSGANQLVRSYGRDPAQPVVDHVVMLQFEYFGDPQPPELLVVGPDETTEPRSTYGPVPPPPTDAIEGWPAGENCAFARVEGHPQSRLVSLGAASSLVQIPPALVTDGPWCPHPAARNRFDADLLRVRRVRFTFRVQTPLAVLRGPAGTLFTFGGVARAGNRYVPDQQMQFDVAPRNLN